MPNTLFLVVFAVTALYGFIMVLRRTRQLRGPVRYKDFLYEWAERPGTSFREDFPTWIAINIHRGTAILLGLVGLLMLIFHPLYSPPSPDWPPAAAFLFGPLLVGIVALLGVFFGFMVGGPFAEAIGGDRHYAVSEAGVLALGQLSPWDAFSDLSLAREQGAVRIWSASLPGTIAFSLHPPAEGWDSLLRVLQAHLPTREEPLRGAERYGFALRMALLCAPFCAAGLILAWMPSAAALMALAVLLWLLLSLGSTLIMRWVYGRKNRPAALEK